MTSELENEVRERENLEAELIDWTDSANALFRDLTNGPDPTLGPDPANNPCGPGSLPPYINEDGALACW